MNPKTNRIQARRLVVATLAVCGLVAAVPVSGALADGIAAAQPGVLTQGIDARVLAGIQDPFTALAGIEELADECDVELPEYFDREIGMPSGGRGARVSDDGQVVGYLLDGDESSALQAVRAHMAERGWAEIPLGDVAGATFVKQDGACTWTLATCTQSGPATCVVFRSVVG